jgi:hypothetical protein
MTSSLPLNTSFWTKRCCFGRYRFFCAWLGPCALVNDSLDQIDDFPDCSILQRFGQPGAMERFAALADIWVMRARFVWAVVWAIPIAPSRDPPLSRGKSMISKGDIGSGGRDRIYDQLINSQIPPFSTAAPFGWTHRF